MVIQDLHTFLRSEFEREARSGFSLARRIPDTRVKHFLDYHAGLSPDAQDELAYAVTLRGAVWISGVEGDRYLETVTRLPAWKAWRHESVSGLGRDPHYYHSVQELRLCLAQVKTDLALGRPPSIPQELVDYAHTVRGIKTPELRKRLRPAIVALFAPAAVEVGNQSDSYMSQFGGSRVTVGLSLGSQHFQLGYQIDIESADPPGRLTRVGYETALGLGLGQWNFIVEDNIEDTIRLLCEFIRDAAELPHRLPPQCLQPLT